MQGMKRILVIGATSQIGDFLLPKLLAANIEVHAVTRKTPPESTVIQWHQGDVWGAAFVTGDFDAIIHIAYLGGLPVFLDRMPPMSSLKQVIGFGSTGRFTKDTSANERERATAQNLTEAEDDVAEWCKAHQCAWTILRPTLIYGRGTDGNISTIVRFIRRFRLFPLIGDGSAQRQPVHAEDLAQVVMLALGAQVAYGKAYNVSGGETLTYREMVARIFKAMDKRPLFVPVPLALLRVALAFVRLFPGYRHLTMEMATRMQRDLVFDHDDATRDLGYSPGPFRPNV